MPYPSREEALALLHEWTQGESLRRHGYCVEAAMRHYAAQRGAPVDEWGVTGLLHDFDYEKHPELPDHPCKGAEVLRSRGYPAEMVTAILGHAGQAPRETDMARVLYAVDELCGFLTACAYVQPSKKVADVKVSSVKKKFKDKAFARAVNREEIFRGAEELGVEMDAHIQAVLEALSANAGELGL
ncbi:MAG: HDIG domain-containing protein [Candidatus Eisenbacteria bacterium]|nr:HDIG domain-containing protein [Candidatus Eisenbacteria bacterium]